MPQATPAGVSTGPRAMSALATRERVLNEAANLFLEHGFEATSIRQIAANAEVSIGTVMGIGDKDALLVYTFDHLIEQLHETYEAEVLDARQDWLESVLELLSPFIELFATHLALARKYASILLSGKHQSQVFTSLQERLLGEIEHILANSAGRSGNLGGQARGLYYAYLGALFSWAASQPKQGTSQLYDELRTVLPAIYSKARYE